MSGRYAALAMYVAPPPVHSPCTPCAQPVHAGHSQNPSKRWGFGIPTPPCPTARNARPIDAPDNGD